MLAWLKLRAKPAAQITQSSGAGNTPHLVALGLASEFKNSDLVFTGSLTNKAEIPIRIVPTILEYEDASGRAQHQRGWDQFHRWSGMTNFDTLLADQVATLTFDVPRDAKRVRLVFQYLYDGGGLEKAISQAAGKLPVKKLSPKDIYWLNQNGFLDGQCKRTFEGEWVAVPTLDQTISDSKP